MNPCLLIPIYDHGPTIAAVVDSLAPAALPLLIVDDGSGAATRRVLDDLAAGRDWVTIERLPANRGKGGALKAGYRAAHARGFSHAVQLDADGQHDAGDVPRFLATMRRHPQALVLGSPVFDDSVPRHRLYSRQLSRGLVWLATLSFRVRDPLVGFRGIPLAPTIALLERMPMGDHMEFDPELIVRLFWEDVPIHNLETRVIYDPQGLSHFDVVRDDLRLAWLYARLVAGMLVRAPRLARRALPSPAEP